MAFGKKDKDETVAATEDAPALKAEATEDAPAAAEAAVVEAAAAAAPAPAAVGTDALLSMFETTKEEAEDNALLLDLAGDAEIDDLLEMLQTVAAALGIDTSTPALYEEQLAA